MFSISRILQDIMAAVGSHVSRLVYDQPQQQDSYLLLNIADPEVWRLDAIMHAWKSLEDCLSHVQIDQAVQNEVPSSRILSVINIAPF